MKSLYKALKRAFTFSCVAASLTARAEATTAQAATAQTEMHTQNVAQTAPNTSIAQSDLKTAISTLLFLSRNAQTLTFVSEELCPMASLEEALALMGDDGEETTSSSLNLKVYTNRNVSGVYLSITDTDGTLESGLTFSFDVSLRESSIIKNEVRCFFAG